MSSLSIGFAPFVPLWALLSLGLAAVVVLALGLVSRAAGTWLRALLAAALLLTLANPSLVAEQREPLKDVALIVVDESPSQMLADRPAQTEAILERLAKRLDAFARTLEVRTVRVRHDSVADAATGTSLFGPLGRALADVPTQRHAATIMVTDGRVHDIPRAMEDAGLPGPIHVLLTGERDEHDRRLVVVEAPSFGLVGKEVPLTIRIEDEGLEGATARVELKLDGGPGTTLAVPVGRDHRIDIPLNHRGPTVVELSVEAGPRELTLANNNAVVSINGVRDRLRVLLVSGEPHPGERTWRNLLKSDASVDLVHFTILRPPEKQDGTPIHELSLIAFPTRELFEVKLAEFDLIVFDRYRRRGVLPSAYLRNIVEYVENGGALLEAAGPSFATPFSLYRTPLGQVLPGEPTGEVLEFGYQPRITGDGLRHPVTADLPGSAGLTGDTDPRWGRWFRLIDVVPDQGRQLMSGADGRPLLILHRYGEGRVAQLMSDHIWLWARGYEGGGPQAELLRRMAHWLMKEPELEESDLRAEAHGDTLQVTLRSVDPMSPVVEVTAPDGEIRQLELTDMGSGRYTAELPLTQAGLYRVSDGDRVAMAAAGALNPKEMRDVTASETEMRVVADATGGTLHWLADGEPSVRQVAPGRRAGGRGWMGLRENGDFIVTGVRDIPLLPGLVVLLLVLGLAALAWRREAR